MAAPTKFNWDLIRADYVEGLRGEDGDLYYPTLREIAARWDASYDRVKEVAAEQKWTDEKQAWLAALQRERREAKLRELSQVGVEFDSESLNDSRVGLRLIGAHLGRIAALSLPPEERSPEQLAKYRKRLENGDTAPADQELLDASEMARLARAAITWQRVGKVALGDTERYGDPGAFSGDERVDVQKALTQGGEDALFGILMSAARSGLLDDFDPGDEEVIEVNGVERGRADEGPYPIDDAGAEGGDPQ